MNPMKNQPLTTRPKTNSENLTNLPADTNFFSISFKPSLKYLSAEWHKPVSSGEYRQSVRTIVRSIAFLQAELVLINISAELRLTPEDQLWTATFLQDALSKTKIRRSARVIPNSTYHETLLEKIISGTGYLPYAMRLFQDKEQAMQWLFAGEPHMYVNDEQQISVPLDFNIKLLRQKVLHKPGPLASAPQQSEPLGSLHKKPTGPNLLKLNTEYVAITLDHHESLMSIRWLKSPISRQYRYGMLKAGRALLEHKLERVLLNNQRLGMLTLEDQGWLVTSAIRMLPGSNLKKLAVVTSSDALQQMSSDAIGCKLREAKLPYEARYFLTEEEAREWLFHSDDEA